MRSRGLRIFRALLCCVFSLGLLVSCAEGDDGEWAGEGGAGDEFCEDLDGDGYLGMTARCQRGTDCDDTDERVHPAAAEVCGDGIDNDCSNGDALCTGYCVDRDEDGFGYGEGCLGPDCDDSNPDIYPGALEVCGNGIDENCDGQDAICPQNCTDLDGDGYGPAGQNSDCPREGVDCDDTDASVNPGAEEVCNGIDDNCDGRIDECESAEASCSGSAPGDACVVAIGQSCASNDDCESPARCDTNVSECRYPVGESCNNANECLAGYACHQGACSGEFCDINTCSGQFGFCFSEAERCVECDPDAPNDGGCTGGQTCSYQGFCGDTLFLAESAPSAEHPGVRSDIFALSVAIADCWIDYRDADRDQLCQLLFLGDDVGPITEADMKSAFVDGKLNAIGAARYEALDDLWGQGFWNVKNIDWRSDPQPGSFLEYCVWYDTVRRDEVIIEKCSEFSP